MSGGGYDLGCHIYNSDGKVVQIDYAQKAVDKGGALLGVRCKDGVVMVTEKLLEFKLLLPNSGRVVHKIDRACGISYTGYTQDGRAIVPVAEDECSNFKDYYGESIPPHVLAERIAMYMHLHTMYGGYRPFGLGVLVTAFDELEEKAFLHMINTAGVTYRFYGAAIGKGRQGATTELEKLDLDNLTCEQALEQLATIILLLRDEPKGKPFVLEAGWLKDKERTFEVVDKAKMDEITKIASKNVESREAMATEP